MADVEDALFTRISGNATVTAIIGTKLYPHAVPPGTPIPYIAYERISAPREHAMGSDPGNVHARFEFTCADDTTIKARALGNALRGAISRYRNRSGSPPIDDILIDGEAQDDGDVGPKTRRFKVLQDYIVHYTES